MSDTTPKPGTIGWMDLTVKDATALRDFYAQVVGWSHSPVDMGGYQDFCMNPQGSESPAAGICHARGNNADLPAQWLIYITVSDLDRSMARCKKGGGRVISGPRDMGSYGRFCVIQDPAGAVAGLIQPA